MGRGVRFFQQNKVMPTEIREVLVTASPAWPRTADDGQLLALVKRTVENTETFDGTVVGVDVQAWRPACYEDGPDRFVGRGCYGRSFDTLRHAQVVEVRIEVVYDRWA